MDTLQILDKVNTFYSNSFSQLITITIAILGFSGIILPIVIQFIQNRVSKIEHKTLQSQISLEIDSAKRELKKELESFYTLEQDKYKSLLDEQIKKFEKVIEVQDRHSNGNSYFLQGKINLEKKQYASATKDYLISARYLFLGEDDLNAQRAIDVLKISCLPNLDSKAFSDEPGIEDQHKKLMSLLQARNTNGRFSDAINDITKGISRAKDKNQ